MSEPCRPKPVRLPSASKLELLVDFCNFFPNLPWDDSPPGEAARTGTLVHSMIESAATGMPYEVPEGADVVTAKKKYAKFAPWWERHTAGRVFWPEVAFLYNALDGSVKLAGDDWFERGRPREPHEIPAIIDTLHVNGDHAIAYDFKTGKKQNVTAASANVQLAIAALCLQKMFKVSTVEVGAIFLFVRKEPELVPFTLDAMDLMDFEQRLQQRCRGVEKAFPNPGDWCWKCPAKKACPARGGASRDPVGVPGEDFPEWMA